jgi:hypothetical protein
LALREERCVADLVFILVGAVAHHHAVEHHNTLGCTRRSLESRARCSLPFLIRSSSVLPPPYCPPESPPCSLSEHKDYQLMSLRGCCHGNVNPSPGTARAPRRSVRPIRQA